MEREHIYESASKLIRRVETGDFEEWLRMRAALWPDEDIEDLREEIQELLADEDSAVYVATRVDGGLCGFIEVGLRDYAEGCDSSPAAYIEGWYVDADQRRGGVGARLVQVAEAWGREAGCREIGSDCLLDNLISYEAHLALGYDEVERLIVFRKDL